MNLFELFVKIGVKDEATKNVEGISSKLGKGLKTAAKIGTAAVGAAAAGIVALTKAAVENYAEYEQLVGGVETLFKNSADIVQGYAANAYKTAGLSANEYMSTVTSFSASLLQSLGGDTKKAAEYADMAVSDMSDNANKMGTSMEMIQNAYQGFAKQNYTMLDNLKLGYGGTKTEMQRLVKDAAKIDKSINANSLSFGNIVKAINVVQKEMGIYGTTALEAEKTISGSIASTKAAWQNLITGVADDNADFEKLIDDFVKSVGKTANNILPRIQTALEGGGKLVEELVPVIIEQIPEIVENTLPKMLRSGVNIINKILEGISKDPDKIVNTVFKIATLLIKSILDMLPKILNAAIQIGKSIIDGVWKGISNAASWFADKVKRFFSNIVDTVKKTLGIASPSKVFAAIGKFMAEGVGVGWNGAFKDIQRDINSSLDFDGGYIGSFGGGALSGADGYMSRDINIVQNIYSQAKTAAELMREARWQAKMEVLTSV
jgi:hypothetical protein